MTIDHDTKPLAVRMRPNQVGDFYGQEHILGLSKPLRQAIEKGFLHSMILWGPPGSGKTSLAMLIATKAAATLESHSAVLAGVKEMRAVIERAKERLKTNVHTLLFLDEIHRFNKAQQDLLLPFVEEGIVTLIGATTENPSFEVNGALLSRCRVYVLKPLSSQNLVSVLDNALKNTERGLGKDNLQLSEIQKKQIAATADGDARKALNLLQSLADLSEPKDSVHVISDELFKNTLTGRLNRFDKAGEIFYDCISALHKSVRGSDPDASLYWLCRMLEGGCDPIYLLRRIVRMASEDIGNADPRGLSMALDAWDTFEKLGKPEGELAIAQAVIYLACAPKSNACYLALKAAQKDAAECGSLPVPLHLRNAPTQLMKALDYGKAYRYPHDEPDGFSKGVHYFPEELPQKEYYQPVDRGLEIKIKERLNVLRNLVV